MESFDHNIFRENGYFLLENVLKAQECQELIKASHDLPSFKDGTFTPVMNPHKLDDRFFQVMKIETLLEVLKTLFSGEVSGLQSQFFFCRPGTPGFSKHQDNFYVQARSEYFVSAWLALEDVTPLNGGLFVYPGSHRESILPTESITPMSTFGQDPNAISRQTIVPQNYEVHSLVVPKGAVVFIHGHIVHGSHDNVSQRFRHALLLTYIKKGEEFRKGFSAQRQEINLSNPVSMSA